MNSTSIAVLQIIKFSFDRDAFNKTENTLRSPIHVWTAFQFSIAVAGTFFNTLVILSFVHFANIRSLPQNILLLNLAIASLILDSLLPIATTVVLLREFITIPGNWCLYFHYVQQSVNYVSAYFVCAISINRCSAVVVPSTYKKLTRRQTFWIFASPCWVIPPVVLLLFIFKVSGEIFQAPGTGVCQFGPLERSPIGYWSMNIMQGIFLFGPTAIMLICYSTVVVKMFAMHRFRKGSPIAPEFLSENRVQFLRERIRERRLVRSVVTIFSCFIGYCLAYYPERIYKMATFWTEDSVDESMVRIWLRSLYNLGTIINPVRKRNRG